MNRKVELFIVCFLIVQTLSAQNDTILNRYKQYLFDTLKVASNAGQVSASLNINGQWDDIDYTDLTRANWKPLNHLKRLRDLAVAYTNPESEFYHHTQLLQSINRALAHWIQRKYKCPNWWHNEIGVPQQMRDIIILLRSDLSQMQFESALEVLAQYQVRDNSTGANLTWSADLGLHYGLLTNNLELAKSCIDHLVKEIRITLGDGIQPDYSFHQHDKRLQMYQYGGAFFRENVRIAWELRNTKLAFPSEKIKLLSDFLLNGWQWMTRGISTVPGTMDRSASRKDALQSSDIRQIIPFLIELIPEKESEFIAIAQHQNGKGALNGFRYFPYSDFTAYQQNKFSFFLKTISTRTLPTESINSENLKGHLLNSGDTYFISNGKEYFNMMPIWNWEYLPGVTSFKGAERIKRKPFVGSVGNGDIGFTSMDYVLESKDENHFIAAKKTWFCNKDKIVCLVADLKGEQVDSAYTAMDQCRNYGDITVNKKSSVLSEGNYFTKKLQWVHHGDFAYIPITAAAATIQLQTVSGSWTSINSSETDEIVQSKIFMPVLLHGNLSKPQSFAYMLQYSQRADEVRNISKHPGFKIIRNDSLCQAVVFSDGTFMASFFQAGSVYFKKRSFVVKQPCLIMVCDNKIYASDPLQSNNFIEVQISEKKFRVKTSDSGVSIEGTLLK